MVVMHLHEPTPFGRRPAGRRDGWRLERLAQMSVDDAIRPRRHALQDARVRRKAAVLPAGHVGGRVSIQETLPLEPPHDTAAHLLGEGGQMSGRDRPGGQEGDGACRVNRRAPGNPAPGGR